jgi:hypothetical protein
MRTLTLIASLLAVFAICALAADVTGTWKGSMETPQGTRETTLNLKADGNTLTGTITGRQGEIQIQDGKVKGDNISFNVVRNFNGNEFKMEYKGKLKGDELNLDVSAGERSFKLTLNRQ